MRSYSNFISEARRAKKARKGSPTEKQVKTKLDRDEFTSGKISAADKHKSEVANAKKWPMGTTFSSYRMTGSQGHGSEYQVNPRISYIRNEEVQTEGAAWTKKSGKDPEGGLNEKGRKSYEKENPGSDLKRPSKKVGNPRRKSFCARMKGMRKRQKPSNNTGEDRLSKSLRAWNC